MRILFVSFFNPFLIETGVEVHIRGLSQALCKLGCEIHILVLISKGFSKVSNKIKVHGLSHFIHHLPIISGHVLPLTSVGSINNLCREYKIDIIHGQSPSTWAYSFLRERNIPFVVTLHSTSFGELESYFDMPISHVNAGVMFGAFNEVLSALLTCVEYRYADKVVAVSNAIGEDAIRYFRLPRERVAIIHNGIDLQELDSYHFHEDEKREHTILSIGRLVWRKGHKYLIDAMPYVLSEYPDANLLIIGEGDQKAPLMRRVKELGIDDSVHFLGRVSRERLYSLYREVEVYVQPSLYEPFGITILEAMSMKKPVIATRVGGIPEIITNGVEGLLVEPKNSLQLANAIIHVFSDSSLRERLGNNARKKVEKNFTWEAIAKKYIELYNSLLDEKKGP